MASKPYADHFVTCELMDGKKLNCPLAFTPDQMLHFLHPVDDSVILIATNIFPQAYRDLKVDVQAKTRSAINAVLGQDGYMDRASHYYQNPLVSVLNGLPVKDILPPQNVLTGFWSANGKRIAPSAIRKMKKVLAAP